ncbi:hypothetical protein [Micromonospora narathiwatensis]|uniref:hypothetical protein n=1 Tax=Micromonospora narathiwatensis TaxID=299146 RepID=UPI001430D8D7|nr:hypothetical protein [Micromonospora narathiwatensis]
MIFASRFVVQNRAISSQLLSSRVAVTPMAVELAKASLWIESLEPGRPLTFLDAHVRIGNALIGGTPALLRRGP